jgi:hypothetical protein
MHPLAVSVDCNDFEAGMSYVFRSLCANGLSMGEAQAWLSVRTVIPTRIADLGTLAWATNVSRHWLGHRMVMAATSAPHVGYRLAGHRFGPGAIALAHNARSCPLCIRQHGYHKTSWQLECVPGCVEHGLLLLERCQICRRGISWRRPAVDICDCGRFLMHRDEAQAISPGLANWIRWVESRLTDCEASVPAAEYDLPPLLATLSVDGATRLLVAAGLLPAEVGAPQRPSRPTKTSAGMAEVLTRGVDRLTLVGRNPNDFAAIAPLVHVPALERMRAIWNAPEDVHCAELLLEVLRRSRPGSDGPQGNFPRGQLFLI